MWACYDCVCVRSPDHQVGVAVTVIFPLTMLRSLDSLRFTSLAALACISSFVLVVTVLGAASILDPGFRDTVVLGGGGGGGVAQQQCMMAEQQADQDIVDEIIINGTVVDPASTSDPTGRPQQHDGGGGGDGFRLFPRRLDEVISAVPIIFVACVMISAVARDDLSSGARAQSDRRCTSVHSHALHVACARAGISAT